MTHTHFTGFTSAPVTAPITGPPAGHPHEWVQAPYALLRVAGLPSASVRVFDTPDSAALVSSYLYLEQHYTSGREHLSLLLSAQVQSVVHHQTCRQATIRLRRALYSRKMPRWQDCRAALPAMPARLRRLVQRALSTLARMRAAPHHFAVSLPRERTEVTRALKSLLRQHPQFLAAFDAVNAPLLDAALPYLREPTEDGRDWRRLELTLLAYVMRASLKTSPLSRLAWNIAGQPTPVERPMVPVRLLPQSMTSVVVLHKGVTRRLFQAAAQHPALEGRWRYTVNPDLQLHGGILHSLVRERGALIHDRQVTLDSPRICQLLGRLRQLGDESFGTLLSVIASSVKGADESVARRLLERLIQQQFLIRTDSPRDDTDPVDQLVQTLSSFGLAEADDLVSLLQSVRTELRAYGASPVEERRAGQARLRALIGAFFARCGQPQPELPKRLLYENASAESLDAWLPLIPAQERRALATLATLFDARVTKRLQRSAAFVHQYHAGGSCPEPLEFLSQGITDLPQPTEVRSQADERALERIHRRMSNVQRARREFIDHLARQVQQGQDEIGLQFMDEVRERYELPWPTRSMSVFLQRAEGDRYVLNGFASGHGLLWLRHLGLSQGEENRGQVVAEHVAQLWPEGVVAQLALNSESTINSVPQVLPHALAMPTTVTTLPTELRIHDLLLLHNQDSDELEFRTRQHRRIIPLYLGTLAPWFLAPFDRAIAEHSPSLSYQAALLTELERHAGPRHGPRHWPRLRLGLVVVSRQSWVLDPQDLPARQKHDDDFAYWCGVRRWLQEQRLPVRFFAHSFEAWRSRARNADQSQEAFAKPHYFDLNQYHFLRLFERWSRELVGTWCLQEVDPDTPGTADIDGQRHIAEICTELSLRLEHP